MARGSTSDRGQEGGRGQGGGRGSDRGNGHGSTGDGGRITQDANQPHHEPSDDDEHVVAVRRGPVVPPPLPTHDNRICIWVENDEFNIHNPVSRTIGSILRAMWSGPWLGWKDVPSHHRERMFERFQNYYQWKEECNSSIHSCWERCIKGKFRNLLKQTRDQAKAHASKEGIEVGSDWTHVLPFKPRWIHQEHWATLVDAWNSDSWKDKSTQNIENRGKATGGRHTLGSKSFVTARKDLEKTLKRRANFGEFWEQTHAKKGSRPLDRLVESSSIAAENGSGEDDDMEETTQEHEVTWVDTRAKDAYNTYNKYVVEKYGDDPSLHPEMDMELWSQTVGGKKKGRLYGTSDTTDPYFVMTGAPSMPGSHSSYPPEKSDEVQRLKEKVAELEQDKIEKQAMMEKFEETMKLYSEMNERLQALTQNPPQRPT